MTRLTLHDAIAERNANILRDYDRGAGPERIAMIYNITPHSVRAILRENGRIVAPPGFTSKLHRAPPEGENDPIGSNSAKERGDAQRQNDAFLKRLIPAMIARGQVRTDAAAKRVWAECKRLRLPVERVGYDGGSER